MTKKTLERRINHLFDKMEKECGGQCIYCPNWLYPCGYKELIRLALKLNMEEEWNSNWENTYRSFAPTYIFSRDGVKLRIDYSGWEVE